MSTGRGNYETGGNWSNPLNGIQPNPGAAAPPDEAKKLAAEVEAAAKKLQAQPDDKQALEALEKAVERLRQAKAPDPQPRAPELPR